MKPNELFVRVESAAQAAAIIRAELPKVQKEERVFVLPLDANGKMLAKPILVSVGHQDGTTAIDAGAIFREALAARAVIKYRSIVVNRAERTAFCNDKDLKLKGQTFDFLVLLLDNRGRFVPTKRILKEICPGAKTLGLDAVRQAKMRLCERLEACGAENVIDTRKGVGYAIL